MFIPLGNSYKDPYYNDKVDDTHWKWKIYCLITMFEIELQPLSHLIYVAVCHKLDSQGSCCTYNKDIF